MVDTDLKDEFLLESSCFSKFDELLEQNYLYLPDPSYLTRTDHSFPFNLIADDGFVLGKRVQNVVTASPTTLNNFNSG